MNYHSKWNVCPCLSHINDSVVLWVWPQCHRALPLCRFCWAVTMPSFRPEWGHCWQVHAESWGAFGAHLLHPLWMHGWECSVDQLLSEGHHNSWKGWVGILDISANWKFSPWHRLEKWWIRASMQREKHLCESVQWELICLSPQILRDCKVGG